MLNRTLASLALALMAISQLRPSLLVNGKALGGEQQQQPQQQQAKAEEVDPIRYLGDYGYLTKDEANKQNSMDVSIFEQAVREFQRFANITESGKVDARTRELMGLDRCGNNDVDKAEALSGRNGTLDNPFADDPAADDDDQQSDPEIVGELNLSAPNSTSSKSNMTRLERARRYLERYKRYALSDYKWPRLTITYRTEEYSKSKRVKREDWDQTLEQAFSAWSSAVPFKFVRRSRGKVDIEVKFVKGQHEGCDQDMKEKSEVLAHAYPPGKTSISGDIHFNDHHKWTTGREKVDGLRPVLPVAIHEIGHSLGVKHSHIEEAVMYPFNKNHFQLARDDRVAIRKHYANLRKRVENTDQHHQQTSRLPAAGCGGQSYLRSPECGQFYDCTGAGRQPLLKYCPPGLFWRQSKFWCDWPHNVPECNNAGDLESVPGETAGGTNNVESSSMSTNEEAHNTEEPHVDTGETIAPEVTGNEEYDPNNGEYTLGNEEGLGEGEQESGELAPGELNTGTARTKKARRTRKKVKKKVIVN